MDTVIAIVLTIEIVFIFVSSILVIIRNLEWFKRKMTDAQLLLFDIILSLTILFAMVVGDAGILYAHIPPFRLDILPVWVGIALIPLVIARLIYDYRKEIRNEEGANNELRIR